MLDAASGKFSTKAIGAFLSNAVVAVAVVSAAAAAVVVVRREFFEPPAAAATQPIRRVSNWRRFIDGRADLGPPTVPVLLVEWADFQCPFCRKAFFGLDSLMQRYRDINQLVLPEQVLAIEVCRGPSEVPEQYGGAASGCGAILVWTKR